MGEEKEMSFLEHLEELRWHIIRALISIVVFAVLAFVFRSFVFTEVIFAPSRTDFWTYRMLCQAAELISSPVLCIDELPFILQSRQMTGQFTMAITASFVIGIIISFPYAFWEFWRFISPGLYDKERTVSKGAVFFVSLLFITGILFGYYIVSPLSINFLANFQLDPDVANEFDIISYVSTITMLVLASGILFQLPIVVYFLTKAGIVTPDLMRQFRRHSIVVILALSAIITPPDPMSQILIALPLLGLYEVSIYISKVVLRKRERELAEMEDDPGTAIE
ncbi:MAG: twin-arginine translocase subunit TatC [Candidatus Cyclobacteriaceae bacterium M3_2C_046]